MAGMFRTEEFKTPECRVSYAQGLFVARAQDGGKPKFGCTLIFPNSARAELEKYVAKAIVGQWGDNGIERAKKGLIKSPFLAGDGKEARNKDTGDINPGLGPDVFFIRPTANADRPPVIRFKSENTPATPEEVYSGCFGFAVLTAFTWKNPQNGDGVSFGLQFFQKKRDGDVLGGGGPVDPSKWHEKIEDAGEMPDSAKSGAGAAGLFG